jgi:hypothetical protein
VDSTTLSISTRFAPFKAHSQIVRTRQSAILSCLSARRSTEQFLRILVRQKVTLVEGHLNRAHPCRCQKHPWTKITARCFGKTRSGLPGKLETCKR